MSEVINLIKSHRSIRKFLDKPIAKDTLIEIIKSGQYAASSSFVQSYTIIRISNKEVRKKIAKLGGDQEYIEKAPEFLVFCADLHRLELACKIQDVNMVEGYTESFILATVDTAIVAQNIMIAAESLGLGGVYIGGIRNNPENISQILNIPKNVYPVFGMCLGYPDEDPMVKPRLPLELILKEEQYSSEGDVENILIYDETLKKYYLNRTNGERSEGWTNLMARKMRQEKRPFMKNFLRNQGFEMK